jgi:cyclase
MHSHSRRSFLAAALGGSVLEQAVVRAAQARALASDSLAALFEIEKVTDGVYAAVALPAPVINCNAVIFENANNLMIVDTHSVPSAAAALAAQIRREVSPKPVAYIVNTHFHLDHVFGNPAYKQAAPGASIISSTVTRRLIAEFDLGAVKSYVAEINKAIPAHVAKVEAAKTPEEKARAERDLAEIKAFIADAGKYTLDLPDITFSDNLVIHDKAHELHLAFRGRGHTAGDIVVYCPQKRVLASGDLAHGFAPYFGDGYPREWVPTLKSISAFDYTTVAGGHGAVQHGRERLEQMAAYIEELVAAVDNGRRAGFTVEKLQENITPATLKSFQNGGYGDFLAASMIRYYADSEHSTPAEVLAGAVKGNIGDIYKNLERT